MLHSKSTIAIPPGYTIREQLEFKGMMQKEFAQRMDLSEKHISQLINGKVELTQEVALKLEFVLGIPASFWNNLESIYREKLVRVKDERDLEDELSLLPNFPFAKMVNLGWIEKTKDKIERIIYLRRFFEVAKLDVLSKLGVPGIVYRKTNINDSNDYDLAVWAQKARLESRAYQVASIDINRLKESIPRIRSMTVLQPEEFCPELIDLFKSCGVALVFLPHLDGTYLHGATFIDGNKVVMGLTVRGLYADKFWFSLFHELHHIISGHIYNADKLGQSDEDEADRFARDTLISLEHYKKLLENGVYDDLIVYNFARSINIATGIVVGRLQKEKVIGYDRLNKFREKYSIDN